MSIQPSLYFLVDGSGFILGVGLTAAAIVLRSCRRSRAAASAGSILAPLAVLLIAASATPISPWLYWVGGILLALWFIGDVRRFRIERRYRTPLRIGAMVTVVAWLAAEVPFIVPPSIPPGDYPLLQVIGDSISSGIGSKGEVTWPSLLRQDHRVEVVNLSRAGHRLDDALSQARSLAGGRSVVLLEIGGNDLIAPSPTQKQKYEADLDGLLQAAASPDRLLVMFELPTFPFENAYGRVQRRIARRYDVILIPRRYLVDVIRAPGNTSDGIHLTEQGHHAMATLVWRILGPSLVAKHGVDDRPQGDLQDTSGVVDRSSTFLACRQRAL